MVIWGAVIWDPAIPGTVASGCLISGEGGASGVAISGTAGAAGAAVDFRAAEVFFFAEVAFFAGVVFFAAGARRGRFGASSSTGSSITGSAAEGAAGGGGPAGVPGSALAVTSADGRGRGGAGTSAAGSVACAGSGGWKRTVGAALVRRRRGGVSPVTSPRAGSGSGAGGGVKVGLVERLRRVWAAGSRRGGSLGGCSCISMERRPERDVAHDENAGGGAFPVVALLRVGTDLYPRARWSPGHQGDFA
ncbi:hypothetical protein ABZ744_18065 [Micromonospora chersina]|uniref:hypothetical protein n=1 Tax=Micromonospora chersina TaxID=47854 RepID=UPI0033C22F0F